MLPHLGLTHGIGRNTVTPYLFARSAVFSSLTYRGRLERPRVEHAAIELAQVARAADMPSISQLSGFRLDQSDADVFYEVMNILFSTTNVSSQYEISVGRSELNARLGRPKGGKTNALLDSSLDRLSSAVFLLLYNSGVRREVSLLKRIDRPTSGDICLEVGPSLVDLYRCGRWTLLKKTERDKLKSPLASALYAYYRTHGPKPHPHKAETLISLVGREKMQRTKNLVDLATALQELKAATAWPICELAATGHVVVEKVPSDKQTQRQDASTTKLSADTSEWDI